MKDRFYGWFEFLCCKDATQKSPGKKYLFHPPLQGCQVNVWHLKIRPVLKLCPAMEQVPTQGPLPNISNSLKILHLKSVPFTSLRAGYRFACAFGNQNPDRKGRAEPTATWMGRELTARQDAFFLLALAKDEQLQAGPARCMLIRLGIVLSVLCSPGGNFFLSLRSKGKHSPLVGEVVLGII